ncbi:MAG: lysoplasmalogenase [Microlunatus sp.]|nr:lysoplasmalogenase [Microlunatus sp.]
MITPRVAGSSPPADRQHSRRPLLWAFAGAFVVCSVLDLIAEAAGWNTPADVFRTLALPLLIAALFAARPPITRTIVLVVGGLLFSWLGDTLGQTGFVIKILLFLVAQWLFIAAFWSYRGTSLLRKPVAVLGYGVPFVVVMAILVRPAGSLAAPVVLYGVSLVTMAMLASGLNRWGMIGGLSFVVSDTLLGIKRFYDLPAPNLMDFLIMLSYLLAEVLLVWGAIAAARSAEPNRDRTGTAGSAAD